MTSEQQKTSRRHPWMFINNYSSRCFSYFVLPPAANNSDQSVNIDLLEPSHASDHPIAVKMPVTTRNAHIRNGTTPQKMRTASPSPERPSEARSYYDPSRPSPYLLLIYPLILGIGFIYAIISPTASVHDALAAGITSDLNKPMQASYFAGKKNLINLFFVKRGWLWTSLALLFLQLTTRPAAASVSKSPITTRNKMAGHYLQAGLRYIIITLLWTITTQWFFGPPLIDRSFTLTGGHCENLPLHIEENPAKKLATVYSGYACKKSGGTWRGGHDISGHVFILVLSSASLLYELYIADRASQHPTVSPRAAANVAQNLTEEEKRAVGGWESETEAKARIYARYFLYGVVALDCLMLFTTAIWFHTWLEKVNGMLIAGIGLYATYFLGDFIPAWKGIVGGL